MQKTLKILGEPPCRNLEEGQLRIIELIDEGKFTQEYLEEIVDYVIDSVKSSSQYMVIVSDSDSPSFKIPKSGVLRIKSVQKRRRSMAISNRLTPK